LENQNTTVWKFKNNNTNGWPKLPQIICGIRINGVLKTAAKHVVEVKNRRKIVKKPPQSMRVFCSL